MTKFHEKVVVIMLNYNQNDYTLKCVDSVLKSDYDNIEILLIDNGSTKENFLHLKEKLPVHKKLLFKRLDENVGYPKGSNYAFKEAEKLNPVFLLIMNNDTVIDKSAISELVSTCNSFDKKARVTGKIYHYDEPNILQSVGYNCLNRKTLSYQELGNEEEDLGQFEIESKRDMIEEVFVLQPFNLYKEIGGYSTYFWINAVEKDLSLRSVENGYQLIYAPKAKIWHKGSVSLGGRDFNPKLAYWNIQSQLLLRYLHLEKREFIQYYFKTCSGAIRTLLKSSYLKVMKGENKMVYARAKAGAILYFNKWLFLKNDNDGHNPYHAAK